MITWIQFLIALIGVFVASSLATFTVSFLRVQCGHSEKEVWDNDFKPTFITFFGVLSAVLVTVFFII